MALEEFYYPYELGGSDERNLPYDDQHSTRDGSKQMLMQNDISITT